MRKKLKLSNKITASIVMILQVMNVFSADLVVDPRSGHNTSIDRSVNGVPIVNISTPNARGISVNDFLEYNVGKMGQVINNSDNVGRSHLAGLINGNPNFGANQAANLIVMQVNGANRSNVEGYIEALSRQRVNVILSNENGIFLNGAGTINIKNFIPTTGKVKLKDGDFVGIDVTKGNVIIGDRGFDAKNTDYVAIISKALELQGKLVTKNLEILAGENSVNADGTFVNKTSGDIGKINLQELGFDDRFKDLITVVPGSNPTNPEIAIDGSLLGSMYAGQIKIIVNNKGAGVNNRGFIVSKDKKLEITADGKVKVNQVQGNGIEIKGQDYEQSSSAYSTQGIDIAAKTITLNGIGTKATDNINLNGQVTNSAMIQTDKNLNTKSLNNSGNILVKHRLNVDGDTLNTGKIEVNKDFVTKDILNNGDIKVVNNLSLNNLTNGQNILVRNNLKSNGNTVNTGNIQVNNNFVTKDLKNSGSITVVNDLNVSNLENSAKILAGNDVNVNGSNVLNSGELLSGNNINSKNVSLNNSGQIGANNKIDFDNSSVSNQHNGKITADKISMEGIKSYTNQGEIVGNETVLTSTNNLDLTGKLHGEKSLVIKGQNIRNDGETTGSENIEIIANDFTNNTEIGAENVKIFASGNVENNNILNGENLTIKAKNLENKDLIAAENKLKLDVKNNLINNPNSSIYGGNLVDIKASNILNKRSEILGGGIKIEAQNARNEVGLIQGNDVFIKTNVFENIGEVKDLNKYTKYYVTWDGKRLSEDEVNKKWIVDKEKQTKTKRSNGSAGQTLRRWQRERFNNIVGKYGGEKEIKSYLLTNHLSEIQSQLEGGRKVFVAYSSEYPIKALEGKLEGNTNTEYAKVIGNNVTIQANSNILNKDGIISSEDTTKLMTNTLENSVTTGDAVQLKDGQERVKIWFERTGKRTNKKVHATVDYVRELKTGTLAHESGQPSIIEGQNVIITAPNIVTSSITEANGQTNVGTIENNTKKIFGKQLNKGTIETNGKVEIIGNNQDLLKIKETGTIEISPTLVSSMFRENEEPTSKYLMETRSKYVQLNNFYGSDYFLTRIGYEDRWDRVRRLGDAYYESQLITKALTERLGSQFINGKSGQDLMKQLMDNALVEKNRQNLKIGIALTQEQRRKLENDIIWYVYKNVNGVRVLAPEIYLTNHTVAEINNDTRNRIGGFEKTYVSANNLENVGTKIGNKGTTIVDVSSLKNKTNTNLISEIAGDDVSILAENDIENIGGKITGENSVELISKQGNITNETTTRTAKYYKHELDRTEHEEIASTGEISSQGTINITGNNVISKGALIDGQDVVINAKNDVKLQEIMLTGEDNFGSNGDNFNRFKKVENVGSAIQGSDSVKINANQNISIRGSVIKSDGNIELNTENINISNIKDIVEQESKSKQKGFLSKSVNNSYDYVETSNNSQIQGKNITLNSNKNIDIKSSNILSENDINITAENVNITENKLKEVHNRYFKKSGISGGFKLSSKGISGNIGYRSTKITNNNENTTSSVSTIYSVNDTNIFTSDKIVSQGTNFVANNLNITAKNGVELLDAVEMNENHFESKTKGINLEFNVRSVVTDLVSNGQQLEQDLRGSIKDGLSTASTVLNVVDSGRKIMSNVGTVSDVIGNAKKPSALVNTGISLGVNKSKTTTDTTQEISKAGTINANNVKLKTDENLIIKNQKINVEKDLNIEAKNVKIETGKSEYSTQNSSKSSGVSGSFDLISKIGSANVSDNRQKGHENGTIYENSEINVGNTLNITSKNDTLISGANIKVNEIDVNVANNFVVESLQNTTTGSSKSLGINVNTNISKNIKPVAGANVGKGRKQGNWIQNQTNITAQNGGTIKVGNEATLVGSVINSENSEIKLETKKLTTTDIVDTQKETNGQIGLSGITKGKVSQTTVGYNQKDKEQITRTTLLNVNVVEDGKVVDLTKRQINQDLEKSQEITKDKEKSFDAPLHTDLLDEETRKQVIRDFKRTIQLPVKIVDGIIYSNTIETHKKTGKVAEKELGKSIRASVRDLNIETLFKMKELRNEYKKQLMDTMDNGQLTDESLKVASKVILGVLAQNGIENPSIVFSTDKKLVDSVAKMDTNHFIINLNNIDITNYDNLIDLMQYEGQRFSYSDKETDDVTANQGTDLDKYLGKTNISSDSELLRKGNEFVANTDLSEFRDRLYGNSDDRKDLRENENKEFYANFNELRKMCNNSNVCSYYRNTFKFTDFRTLEFYSNVFKKMGKRGSVALLMEDKPTIGVASFRNKEDKINKELKGEEDKNRNGLAKMLARANYTQEIFNSRSKDAIKYENSQYLKNKENHLYHELEKNNIHFGKGIDLYDANIKIASVSNEEDLRKVLKVMSENEITVASSEILTYAELQKYNPKGIKIDIKGAMITAGSVESVTSALVAYNELKKMNTTKVVKVEESINKNVKIDVEKIKSEWGISVKGENQGIIHLYNKGDDRINSLADRLGVPKSNFEKTPQGLKNFTEQAKKVIEEAKINGDVIIEQNGRKQIYTIRGKEIGKPNKGVSVIVYDGKIQTMMPVKYKKK